MNCVQCGINLEWAEKHLADVSESAQDQTAQQSSDQPPVTAEPQATRPARPGCVTLMAVLIGISAGLGAIGGIISGASMMGYGDDGAGLITILITCAMAGLYFSIATGLWRLRNWARVAFLVLQALGMLVGMIILLSGIVSVSSVVGLAVGGYTLYWFAVHGEYFQSTSPSETRA